MKLDSKLFDGIRIKPRREAKPEVEAPPCAWEGCDRPGLYKAPKGRRFEGEYHNFCLEHVRHYNTAFNFFEGMQADDIEQHVNETAATAGRPSWGLGGKPGAGPRANSNGPKMYRSARPDDQTRRFSDPLHIFARYQRAQARNPQAPRERKLAELDRRALETLGIVGPAHGVEIKKAYKTLVKIHHPDANGGDKSSEDRLRAIIAAYTHLKAKGFV
jgi:DnaJ domain